MAEKQKRWSCIFLREIYNKNVTVQHYGYRNRINNEKEDYEKIDGNSHTGKEDLSCETWNLRWNVRDF